MQSNTNPDFFLFYKLLAISYEVMSTDLEDLKYPLLELFAAVSSILITILSLY